MKRTQAKSSTASKSSASKKQSVLPISQKATTPAQPKQNPMPSNTALNFPAATSEKCNVPANIVVNCPSKRVLRSPIDECVPPEHFFVASESHPTSEGSNVSES